MIWMERESDPRIYDNRKSAVHIPGVVYRQCQSENGSRNVRSSGNIRRRRSSFLPTLKSIEKFVLSQELSSFI
jgi:hypothetical protein